MQTDLITKVNFNEHLTHSCVGMPQGLQALSSSYSQFGKELEQFAELSGEVIEYFLEFYRTDMIMFGYNWDKQSHTAYCSIDTREGPCC